MDNKLFEEMRRDLIFNIDMENDISDKRIMEEIDNIVLGKGREYHLTLKEKKEYRKTLFYSVRKLDILQELAEDPEVNEIMVNGPEKIFFEKNGQIKKYDKTFSSEERLYDIVQQIAGDCNRVINEQSPIVDARLKNGDRVNIVVPPVALDGPILTIRRFPDSPITINDLVRRESLSREAADELKKFTAAGYSIIVSGGTSTGKTTFLNALSEYIPNSERIVTIEDNAELQLQKMENIVRLEAKPANLYESREITIRDLLKTALRMRPNRIIIGEVRGSEAEDFLTALNTGHSGSLGSVHANSPEDLVLRLESMVRMGSELPISVIRQQIAAGIEMIVQLERNVYGKRQVEKISEVVGYNGEKIEMNTLYERGEHGELNKKNELIKTGKLEKYEAYLEFRKELQKNRKTAKNRLQGI